MILAWTTLLLAGACAVIAQPAPTALVLPASATRIALAGETIEFDVVIESGDRANNTAVQVTTRLWQSAGSMVAPVAPAVSSIVTLIGGRGLFQAQETMPSVRSATEMWLVCRATGLTNTATHFRILVLPEPPLLAFARTATNHVIATSKLPQPFATWLASRGFHIYTTAKLDTDAPKPLLYLVTDRPGERPESAYLRIKQLACSGAPVVWFSNQDGFSAHLPAIVHWHHFPGAQAVIRVPATWQTELETDLAVEYQFAEILKAASDPDSAARELAASVP
jgi:hypothetical protein